MTMVKTIDLYRPLSENKNLLTRSLTKKGRIVVWLCNHGRILLSVKVISKKHTMISRTATANFKGNVNGFFAPGGKTIERPFSYESRFEDEKGTNPEELMAAAHAGCFSMALSDLVTKAGFKPTDISAKASLQMGQSFDGTFRIASIRIDCKAEIKGIKEILFHELAKKALKSCPVSQALSNVEISLSAKLKKDDFIYYY